jgi:hypothetical protein
VLHWLRVRPRHSNQAAASSAYVIFENQRFRTLDFSAEALRAERYCSSDAFSFCLGCCAAYARIQSHDRDRCRSERTLPGSCRRGRCCWRSVRMSIILGLWPRIGLAAARAVLGAGNLHARVGCRRPRCENLAARGAHEKMSHCSEPPSVSLPSRFRGPWPRQLARQQRPSNGHHLGGGRLASAWQQMVSDAKRSRQHVRRRSRPCTESLADCQRHHCPDQGHGLSVTAVRCDGYALRSSHRAQVPLLTKMNGRAAFKYTAALGQKKSDRRHHAALQDSLEVAGSVPTQWPHKRAPCHPCRVCGSIG